MDKWLDDQLKTSRNLIDIALLLIDTDNQELLPTILELLLYYAQTIVDKNCIKGD